MRRARPWQASSHSVELNVIPLIDVVFFLLVFYVISTSFVSETAVAVDRPRSSSAKPMDGGFLSVAVTRSGAVQVGSEVVDAAAVERVVRAALDAGNTTHVLVIPDREVPTGLLLSVMDACEAAGATGVDVAATATGGP